MPHTTLLRAFLHHAKLFWNFFKKTVDISNMLLYNNTCVGRWGTQLPHSMTQNYTPSGCGSAWLERLIWDQEVAGSNPVTPTL